MPKHILQLLNCKDDSTDTHARHRTTAQIDSMLCDKDIMILIVAVGITNPGGVSECVFVTKKTWVMTTGPPQRDPATSTGQKTPECAQYQWHRAYSMQNIYIETHAHTHTPVFSWCKRAILIKKLC